MISLALRAALVCFLAGPLFASETQHEQHPKHTAEKVEKGSAKAALASEKPSKTLSDSDLAMRNWMVEIAKQLGVTCTYCHDTKDFKDKSKSAYKVSAEHIEMTKLLNEKYAHSLGSTKVDCSLCHFGVAKPASHSTKAH